jgi:hypothetical protein
MERKITFHLIEARAKMGKRVRLRMSFFGVAEGTEGTVIRAEPTNVEYGVVVEWSLPGDMQPLVDRFSKEEYERFLVEIA